MKFEQNVTKPVSNFVSQSKSKSMCPNRPPVPVAFSPWLALRIQLGRLRAISLSSSGGEGWGEEAVSSTLSHALNAMTPPSRWRITLF